MKIIYKIFKIDFWLFIGLLALSTYGIFMVYSASGGSSPMLIRKLTQVCLGFGVMIVISLFSPRFYMKIAPSLYTIAIILLLFVDIFGVTSKGAQRWLDLGLFRFQPSEIMKIALPLMLASFLDKRFLPPSFKDIIITLVLIAVPVLLIALEPDLGTAILVGLSGIFVLFLSGISWKYISGGVIAVVSFVPVMWMFFMHDYQRKRVLTLLDPTTDPLGSGYHIIQSKIAIGSGGFWGKGFMAGTQSQLEFLPEPHTDFIFAVLAEELGMIGVLFLLAIYLFIIMRMIYIATQAKSNYGRILVGGLAMVFFIYILINIGMVSGLLPVVGVPLPLFSFGGTSFLSIMLGFGLIMSIYSHNKT